jgi:hypothetical protein
MLVPCCCTILNIKKATYNKDLILNAPSLNDVIKVGTWRSAKKLHVKFGVLPSKRRNFYPCNAPIMIATCPIQAFKTKSIKAHKKKFHLTIILNP